MAFSAGVFSRLYNWVTDRDASVPITASRMDAEMDGMATALSACVLKDGTQTITANIPMSGFLFTGGGAATARTHYARADQVQDDSLKYASTSGTDTYTATLTPAITAYANGLSVYIKFVAANTGAATLNLNGVGAVAIRKFHDVALVSGDIEANSILHLVYNSTIPCFEIIGPIASLSAATTYVVGPASATDNAVARFDATTGKLIQDSVVTIADTTGSITAAGTGTHASVLQGSGTYVQFQLDRTDTHGDNTVVAYYSGRGRDSGGATQEYGRMVMRAVLDNAGAETGAVEWGVGDAGTVTDRLYLRTGLYTPNATSGDKGADTINASAIYDDGVQLVTGWVPIARVQPSAAASAVFTSSTAAAAFDGTYRSIKIIGWLQPATDDVELYFRISDDGGATYEADAGDYRYNTQAQDDGGTNRGIVSTSDTKWRIGSNDATLAVGNASSERIQFEITFSAPNSAAFKKMFAIKHEYIAATGALVTGQGACQVVDVAAITGVQFLFESGDIAAGDVTIYGIRNS